MEFRTQYSDDVNKFLTCPGDPEQKTYKYAIVDGIKQLVHDDFTNTQDYIESFAESTDLHNIIARFMNGDESVLDVRKGFYADLRSFPTSYAEIYEHIQEAQNTFNSLPPEIRQEFDNSYMKYFDSYGSLDWNEKMKKYVDFKEDEVKSDE